MKKYVVDTSVVIEKIITDLIRKKKIKGKILIPNAVVSELENQANRGLEIGFLGLEELQELQKLKNVDIEFVGERPDEFKIRHAKSGEIDAYIRELAQEHGAVLITGDKVQAESGRAFGLEVMHFDLKPTKEKLEIEKFFDKTTMSVHLKENTHAYAKKGKPGEWKLEKISKKVLSQEEIKEMAKEVVEKSRIDPETFVEISRRGSTIIQYKDYRIVIVRTPVADGMEITIVRPIKKLNIEDYKLPKEIIERLKVKARGVGIAGEVGSGKSTFAQALGEYLVDCGKVVKTVESPRDLKVRDEVTQYSKNLASSEEIHDILFLSRPDNVIFDEMRDTPDFKLYTDLRLGGSGVIGVLHAAEPIDTVQRFIGRVDTGMIPNVLDTILFIEKGKLEKVLTLKLIVKTPTGMTEADLARPVVEVRDFTTSKLEYEIYSYGEETVVIPVEVESKGGMKNLAAKEIKRFLSKYGNVDVDIISDNRAVVFVDEDKVAKVIGSQGRTIEAIEEKLGISIDVREFNREKETADFEVVEEKKNLIIYTDPGVKVEVLVDGKFLFNAISSKKGAIKVHKKSNIGRDLLKAMSKGREIEVRY